MNLQIFFFGFISSQLLQMISTSQVIPASIAQWVEYILPTFPVSRTIHSFVHGLIKQLLSSLVAFAGLSLPLISSAVSAGTGLLHMWLH